MQCQIPLYFKLWKVLNTPVNAPLWCTIFSPSEPLKLWFPSNCVGTWTHSDERAQSDKRWSGCPADVSAHGRMHVSATNTEERLLPRGVRAKFLFREEGLLWHGEKCIPALIAAHAFYHRSTSPVLAVICWKTALFNSCNRNMHPRPHWTRNIIMNSKTSWIHDQWKRLSLPLTW